MGDFSKYNGHAIIEDKNGKTLRAMTRGQDRLIETIEDNDIIFVNGPAGCGKTVIATWLGIAAIDENRYERLVLTRPIVTAGEDLGFLPGTFEEKVAPFMQPIFEAIARIKGGRPEEFIKGGIGAHVQKPLPATQQPVSNYKKKKLDIGETTIEKNNSEFYKKVSVCPLAYLRGATKANSWLVVDEAENITSDQMFMMLSRIGHNSKMIICGDVMQSGDLKRGVKSGFLEAQRLLKGISRISTVTLSTDDIVRNSIIKSIILRYANKDKYLFNTEGNRNYTEPLNYDDESQPHAPDVELPDDSFFNDEPREEPDYENLPPPKVRKKKVAK